MDRDKTEVPLATKRAMRAAHLLGKILREHFDGNLCELMVSKSFDWRSYSLNILDNLLLVGGIPRDILLGTEVRDIDVTFNLRELTKIQLNHLRKYHSSKSGQSANCKCAYWQHYLNKFEPQNIHQEEKNQSSNSKNQTIKFHNCSYIFNARYFVDILSESSYLKGRVRITDLPKHGFLSLTITDNIQHESYDLRGTKFEFTDTFDSNKVISVQKMMQQMEARSMTFESDEKSTAKKSRSRWKSIALFPSEQLAFLNEEFDSEIRLIEIEIYPIRLKNKLECYDFSINTAIIPLSSITEFCDSEDEVNIAIWFWEYIVENGLDEIDAIRDIKVHRILRVPKEATSSKELYIIRIHPTTYHFWRCIELMIRLPNFYIDTALIAAHIEDYDHWLNVQYFSNTTHRSNFVNKFTEIVSVYCKDVKDVRAMLHTLEILEFNRKFTAILLQLKELNNELMSAIQSTDNQQILVIFSSYGYPFLFGLRSVQQNSNDNNGNAAGNSVELLRLRNINMQLQNENNKLRVEVETLKDSKTKLAVNSAKAIDQLRAYLYKYQEPLND